MIGKRKAPAGAAVEYREEPVKPAVYAMLAVMVAVVVPLGMLNQKIGAEGFIAADTSQYENLARTVSRDVDTVKRMLLNEEVEESRLVGLRTTPMLIIPDIMPTNMDEAVAQGSKKFKVELSGIYWSPTDPIVTIEGENYHTGDMIKKHRIIEIRETEVVFEDPAGEPVVIYFYDFMNQTGK
jgi:hypothetical protein